MTNEVTIAGEKLGGVGEKKEKKKGREDSESSAPRVTYHRIPGRTQSGRY